MLRRRSLTGAVTTDVAKAFPVYTSVVFSSRWLTGPCVSSVRTSNSWTVASVMPEASIGASGTGSLPVMSDGKMHSSFIIVCRDGMTDFQSVNSDTTWSRTTPSETTRGSDRSKIQWSVPVIAVRQLTAVSCAYGDRKRNQDTRTAVSNPSHTTSGNPKRQGGTFNEAIPKSPRAYASGYQKFRNYLKYTLTQG